MAQAPKLPPKQLRGDEDRATLREYLTKRLAYLRRHNKRAGEKEEGAFYEGGEMEIIFLFDELLGEQAPEQFTRRRKAH